MTINKKEQPNADTVLLASSTGRRLHGAVARALGIAILSGTYEPGEILPGEIVMSETLGVSRPAYREALQALTAKGLIESRPKIGTRILPRERWNLLDLDMLSWAFAGRPDPRLIQSLFELRSIIEPAAAALAAERRDKAELKEMQNALNAMRRYSLASDEGRAADKEFHTLILHATRNDALIALSASIGAAVRWTTDLKQRSLQLARNPIPDHARVYDAIAAGDSEQASAAMRQLVQLALDDTDKAIEGGSGGGQSTGS